MKNWYALYTKAHKEQQVRDLLCNRGLEVFLPLMHVSNKGRIMQSSEPLFPCYLFANFDIRETGLYPVQYTQGLRTVVGFCNQPAVVDEEIIAYIKKRLGDEIGPVHRSRFNIGDAVRISEGPFKDLAAVFDGTLSAAGRVCVLMTIVGRQTRCEVSATWLHALA